MRTRMKIGDVGEIEAEGPDDWVTWAVREFVALVKPKQPRRFGGKASRVRDCQFCSVGYIGVKSHEARCGKNPWRKTLPMPASTP